MLIKTVLALVLVAALFPYPVSAQRSRRREHPPESMPATQEAAQEEAAHPAAADKGADNKISVTEGQITLHGQPLKYKATAGTLELKDEEGKAKANMFFVAYQKMPASDDPAQRPITFIFNGGPGAAAVWLHLGVAGPKRVALNDMGDSPAPPYHLVDNQETWLTATDLVFIDPVGTGYSRPVAGEKAEQFFGVQEDVQSVGAFIRMYTTKYQRWLSPKFLAGESYGTTRAAALSEYLMNNGIGLNGIILISSVLNFQTISFGNGNDLPYVLYLPSYTALAWYNKKLPADLQADLTRALNESEQWALHGYLTDLAAGGQLSAQDRQSAIKKLSRLTGLSEAYLEKVNLRIDPSQFRKELLSSEHKVLGRFDARITGYDTDPAASNAEYDPSLNPFLDAYSATFNDYVRRTLKYESDLKYEVLSGRVRPWNMGQGGSGYLDVLDRLRSALVQTPHLKVMFNSGLFDLATPYLATKYTVTHIDLSSELQKNIAQNFYDAGHMVYHHAPDRQKLTKNIEAFIAEAIGSKNPGLPADPSKDASQ
jgi:carboxypeptidase C (cathepsin A)